MKYLSLFTGIGGFELGIQQAYDMDNRGTPSPSTLEKRRDMSVSNNSDGTGRGSNPVCIGYSEIDKYATSIYQRHFPDHTNYGDITRIDADALPDFDFLCGGFPCQAFSIAGKRKGFDDTRGTLFFDIARILRAKQPRLFLLENVKGLLSHDNGKTFSTIIATLNELGYDIQWQVLNSKNHGVPQNRERVFIVGHLRGTPRPQVFPFTGISGKDLEQINSGASQGYRVYSENGVAPTQASQAGGVGAKTGLIGVPQIRRLTPMECERLQGFPDGWTEGVSDTQRYKTLGNAVTVNTIQDIVSRLL